MQARTTGCLLNRRLVFYKTYLYTIVRLVRDEDESDSAMKPEAVLRMGN